MFFQKQSQSQHCVNFFVGSTQCCFRIKKMKKEGRVQSAISDFSNVLQVMGKPGTLFFSEFISWKAVEVFKKLVHKFCAYLRILFCVWTFVDFSIIYIWGRKSSWVSRNVRSCHVLVHFHIYSTFKHKTITKYRMKTSDTAF